MPERFRVVCTMQGAIQVLWFTFTFLATVELARFYVTPDYAKSHKTVAVHVESVEVTGQLQFLLMLQYRRNEDTVKHNIC